MKNIITEQEIEEVTLEYLKDLGYKIIYGPDIDPNSENPERESFDQVILKNRLKQALTNNNPNIPISSIEEAIKKLNKITNNEKFHEYLTTGIPTTYRKDNKIKHDIIKILGKHNEFLAINQFTVIENNKNRRPDIVLFINGIPLAVIELKNPADEKANIESAYKQIQTYKEEIPSLFKYNEIIIISDGTEARAGTISSNWEWFLPWKSETGKEIAPRSIPQIQNLINGMFNKNTFTDIITNFITFEKRKRKTTKILAAYHQYFTTNKAVNKTIKAINDDKKVGVVWHTQGSGKSLTMTFYAGKLVQNKELENPTLVLLTDRNDLDEQLFSTFSGSHMLLRQKPKQAEKREDLQKLLSVSSGGIIFTTIQKFSPENANSILSKRKNIIVIADEAHRSQYGFKGKVNDRALMKYGYAKYLRDALPNASFIGFTGTPIEMSDKSTPAVFGDYIDIYDIQQAVEDGSTVRIYYESRLAKIKLKKIEQPKIDKKFEELTEKEEEYKREKLKSKWAQLEKVIGSKSRIKKISKDIINHFEKRSQILEGKAMIVGMSRRICVDLYDELIKQNPSWKNKLKVIMTGSASDPKEWQKHIRTKQRRKELAKDFQDPEDPFQIVIVRDMWLTGFDAPSLHTMYLDKPMKEHGLMQAIARVNRVFKDKKGGLIVDYLGLGNDLKEALSTYTRSGGKGKAVFDQKEAVKVMLEKYEIVTNLFHGFNYKKFFSGTPKEKLSIIPASLDHVLKQEKGKERLLKYVNELSKAYSLAVPNEEAVKITDEVGFFQAIKASLAKTTLSKGKSEGELDTAIKQIISKAVYTDKVVDIFEAAGIEKPEVSILSDKFLKEIKGLKQKNLAVEALRKLLDNEIRTIKRTNIIQAKSFAEMLEKTIRKYQNRSIETAEIITEMITLAKEIKENLKRGKELKLSNDEIAFYDVLSDNESAIEVLGDKTLRDLAIEVSKIIGNNASIDWTLRDSVQAKLRVLIKRLLRKYGYPPDKQITATDLVLKQARLSCSNITETMN